MLNMKRLLKNKNSSWGRTMYTESNTYNLEVQNEKYWNNENTVKAFAQMNVSDYIREFFATVQKRESTKVLDCGCGGGRNTELLYWMGFDVYAIDYSPKMIQATQHRLTGKVNPERILAAKNIALPFPADFFDIVLSNGVIHNSLSLNEYTVSLSEIQRVLNKAGLVYMSVFVSDWIDEETIECVNATEHLYRTSKGLGMILVSRKLFDKIVCDAGMEIVCDYGLTLKFIEGGKRMMYRTLLQKR